MTDTLGNEPDIRFNEDQQAVFDALAAKLAGGFSVQLLHGVTGSGKTEIYLQAIRKIVAQQKQAIVLVPEIALTPQTVSRFTSRFKRVAILHSGLSGTERHRYWQMISQGDADVIVGARSAIFAPTPNLGMIVVDEEHESSYKQDTAPRHITPRMSLSKRAQLRKKSPCCWAAETPSLESWHRAQSLAHLPLPVLRERAGEGFFSFNPKPAIRNPKIKCAPHPNPLPEYRAREKEAYRLLTLPRRVRGLELPHIELVKTSPPTTAFAAACI